MAWRLLLSYAVLCNSSFALLSSPCLKVNEVQVPMNGSFPVAGVASVEDPPVFQHHAGAAVKIACLECRRLKGRCIAVPASSRCARCTRLDIPCEFREHARYVYSIRAASHPSSFLTNFGT